MGEVGRLFSETGPEGEEQRDAAALVRALSRAQGFALYFVDCDDPAYCQTVADTVRERLDRRVVDVDLGDVERGSMRPTIDFVLEQRLAGGPGEAVAFVWEFDRLLPSTPDDDASDRHTVNEVN